MDDTSSGCAGCTGVLRLVENDKGELQYEAGLCARCARAFAGYVSAGGDAEGMSPIDNMRIHRNLSYYLPRMELMAAGYAYLRRIEQPAEAPPRQLPRVPERICSACTGYYQRHYCRGEARTRLAFCISCNLVYGSIVSETSPRRITWYGRLLIRLLAFHYRLRTERVQAVINGLIPPSAHLTPPNCHGNRCDCEDDCNSPFEADVQRDWQESCAKWGWPASEWRRGGETP